MFTQAQEVAYLLARAYNALYRRAQEGHLAGDGGAPESGAPDSDFAALRNRAAAIFKRCVAPRINGPSTQGLSEVLSKALSLNWCVDSILFRGPRRLSLAPRRVAVRAGGSAGAPTAVGPR